MLCKFCHTELIGRRKVTCPACAGLQLKARNFKHNGSNVRKARIKIEKPITVSYSQLADIFRKNGMLESW